MKVALNVLTQPADGFGVEVVSEADALVLLHCRHHEGTHSRTAVVQHVAVTDLAQYSTVLLTCGERGKLQVLASERLKNRDF